MKKLVILAALIAVTGAAQAAQTNTGCQGNCPTNGGGSNATSNASGVGIGMGGQGGSGGQGGAGGAGGSASAIGQGGQGGIGLGGMGGSVAGSGNSANSNLNSQGQHQGQSQGQGQNQVANGGNSNQAQSSKNDNRSSAANTNSNANNGNNAAQQVRVDGDTTVSVYRAAPSTAYAPNIAPTALCAIGVSAGGSGMSFGFSIGASYIDDNCQKLEQVRTAAAVLGDKEAAAEMMCGISEAYREARATVGKPCGSRAALGKSQAVAVSQAKPEQYQDPIIRARLGLPPLK